MKGEEFSGIAKGGPLEGQLLTCSYETIPVREEGVHIGTYSFLALSKKWAWAAKTIERMYTKRDWNNKG